MKRFIFLALILLSCQLFTQVGNINSPKKPLRILIIGAHPDDAEKAAGTAALYVANGHQVKLVSLTNGDAGHYQMGGNELAERRKTEAKRSGEIIGVEYICLDNHDGELMPTLENRHQVIRLIREFKPDIVFSPRPNDYHPDHRYTSILIQDAAYMVTVPNICPDTPHLRKNPIFMYVYDRFQKPLAFNPDVVVGIDEVIEKKIDMYNCHTSQMYEWLPYNAGVLDQVPEKENDRRAWLAANRKKTDEEIASLYRDKLIELYGAKKGSKIKYAEAFELSEYGSKFNKDEVKVYFPFVN